MLRDVILCEDCKYFKPEIYTNLYGVKTPIAYDICGRFSEPRGTYKQGFCNYAQPKETEPLTTPKE